MIDWIDESGKAWGTAKRRILWGGYWYANDGFHEDGFSARSVIGKLFEEREGASQSNPGQSTPEVFTAEALAFEVAITKIQHEHWFYLAHYRYVIPNRWLPAKSKILELRQVFPKRFKDERAYYNELHGLHCFLMGKMPDVPRGTNNEESPRKHCAEGASNMSGANKVVFA